MKQDLRDAWRSLCATPTASAVVVISLAFGVGANSAIFSILDAAILRPLPVKEPDRLVLVSSSDPEGRAISNIPSHKFHVWKEIQTRNFFDGEFAWSWQRFNVAERGETAFVDGIFASGTLFEVLGVRPLAGRLLTEADDRAEAEAVAVISYRFWQRQFGGSLDALGRSIRIERKSYTIIGVTPSSFVGLNIGLPFDVGLPLAKHPEILAGLNIGGYVSVMARLGPDQTVESANTALAAARLAIREATISPYLRRQSERDSYLRSSFSVVRSPGARSYLRNRYERPLYALLAIVGVVLLIACANIATLLMARTLARGHELGVRLALGASRARLARLVAVESLLLSVIGGACGLILARLAAPLLVRQLSTQAVTVFLDLSFNLRVALFTAAVGLGTSMLFGIAPILRATKLQPLDVLKRGRSAAGAGPFSFGSTMLVLQVALSVTLLVASALFLRTFWTLAHLDLGFDSEHVLVATLSVDGAGQSERAVLAERFRQVVKAAPGVAAAAVSVAMPAGNLYQTIELELPGGERSPAGQTDIYLNHVSPGWFATLGTAIVAGRDFNDSDRGDSLVAVVNESFVSRVLGGQSPIGTIVWDLLDPRRRVPLRIVGVAEDAAYQLAREPAPLTVYVPIAQTQELLPPTVNLSVRPITGSPAALSRSVAEAIARVDPRAYLTFRVLSDQVNAQFLQERLVAILSGFFGALALVLAAVGLYGVTAYAVIHRRREIGIRCALGASPGVVQRMILGHTGGLVTLGVAIGGILSVWVARFTPSLLFGVSSLDYPTMTAVAMLMLIIGALAAWGPARRAAMTDPAIVLRDARE